MSKSISPNQRIKEEEKTLKSVDSKHFRYTLPSLVTVPVYLHVQLNIPESVKIKWAAVGQPVRDGTVCKVILASINSLPPIAHVGSMIILLRFQSL